MRCPFSWPPLTPPGQAFHIDHVSALLRPCLPCGCTFNCASPSHTQLPSRQGLHVTWHTVGAQFILLNESIHLAAPRASLAGQVLETGTQEERQMPLDSQTQEGLCPRPDCRVSVWLDPGLEKPGLVCVHCQGSPVLATWRAIGLPCLKRQAWYRNGLVRTTQGTPWGQRHWEA